MKRFRKVVVIGLDGLEPRLTEAMMASGELPHLQVLRETGGYARVGTTMPAQTPVAWSTFAVGGNPGRHGIFDFLARDPESYLPRMALYRHEEGRRFLPPKAVNLRGGRPIWDRLTEAGVPSVILRHPCTYPPESIRGRMLSGIGVPDLRGGFGSSTYFAEDEGLSPGESEHLFHVRVDGSGWGRVEIPGPLTPSHGELAVPLDVAVDLEAREIRISCTDGSFSLPVREGEWSDWLHLRFKVGLLQTLRGMVRFFLSSARPLRLFVTPVHYDPDAPTFPISHPWDYAGELRRSLGPFATLGLAEGHNGLSNGRFDEEAYLDQCMDILHERRGMMHLELSRQDEGLFYCLYATPDRIQHMFWRFGEADHPANGGDPPDPAMAAVIGDYYRLCDEIVGEALEYRDDETLVVVASDHGFTSFQRQVELNGWLHRNGYLALKPGVESGEEAGDLFGAVDWGRTRAYGVGMAGLYLNLRGRESEGIVDPEEAPALREEIASRLAGMVDEERGARAILSAGPREAFYRGPYLEEAPDVLVGCAPGYRISGASAMGSVADVILRDNEGRWSGDHVVDPGSVPGVLLMNAPFHTNSPTLADLAPSILQALGVPGDDALEGRSLFS